MYGTNLPSGVSSLPGQNSNKNQPSFLGPEGAGGRRETPTARRSIHQGAENGNGARRNNEIVCGHREDDIMDVKEKTDGSGNYYIKCCNLGSEK